MQKKIMFICTGNICRSAMAEKLLNKKLEDKGLLDNFFVCSAGIYAYPNDVSTYEAIKVVNEEYGVDLKGHKATHIKDSKISEMDLILCMTFSHKNSLISMYPELKDRIFLIKEYVGLTGEVDDPYGGNLKVYSECAKEINYYLDLLIEKEASK